MNTKGDSKMNNISFTSSIKPVNIKSFSDYVGTKIPKKNFANFPWNIESSVVGKDVYTNRICDCTSCIITDGNNSILMHLNPEDSSNHCFNNVLMFLRNHIDLKNENLQGLLVGSKDTKKSLDIYNKFSNLLNQLEIKFSELQNGKSPTSVAYLKDTDEFLVSNAHIDRALKRKLCDQDVLKNSFKRIHIADCDDIA